MPVRSGRRFRLELQSAANRIESGPRRAAAWRARGRPDRIASRFEPTLERDTQPCPASLDRAVRTSEDDPRGLTRRVAQREDEIPLDRTLATPIERTGEILEARETILHEQERRSVARVASGTQSCVSRRARMRNHGEPRGVHARERGNPIGERDLEGGKADDRSALAYEPARDRARTILLLELQREQAVERELRRLREPFEALGLMREVAKELAPGPPSAKPPRDERTQRGKVRAPRREAAACDLRANGGRERRTLREAHVARMTGADERLQVVVRCGGAQRIGSRWIWRTSLSEPRR